MKLSLSPHEIDVEVKSMWGRMIIRPHKVSVDFIKIRFDFWTAFCVSAKFGSYADRNMFP